MKIYDRTNAISKAQIEIWEIREQFAEEVKDLPLEKKFEYIRRLAKAAGNEYRKRMAVKSKEKQN